MAEMTLDDIRAGQDTRWFYVGMAGVCVLVAFGGFVPTYWAKLASGTFGGAPILHIHGALFFAWTAVKAARARKAPARTAGKPRAARNEAVKAAVAGTAHTPATAAAHEPAVPAAVHRTAFEPRGDTP